jgi:hypothetical protein
MANLKISITLISILKDSNYDLSLFQEAEIKALESKIKLVKNKPYVECIIRQKEVQLKPEEAVRQLQLKKGCSGTILTAIGIDEFKKVILPAISTNIQKEIKQKITEMYRAKALSKNLLDIAKRGVEMAIEKNEKDAERWINNELNKVGVGIKPTPTGY